MVSPGPRACLAQRSDDRGVVGAGRAGKLVAAPCTATSGLCAGAAVSGGGDCTALSGGGDGTASSECGEGTIASARGRQGLLRA